MNDPAGGPHAPRALFVSDLDGTLLDEGGQVPPQNLAAIERARGLGVAFAVATGRRRSTFRRVRGRLDGVSFRTSLSNGAVILAEDNERFASVATLPWEGLLALGRQRDAAVTAVLAITVPPEPEAGAAEEPDAFVITPDGTCHRASSPWDRSTYVAVDLEAAMRHSLIHAALLFDDRADSSRFEAMARATCGGEVGIHSVRSPVGGGVITEVVVPGGKGNAVRRLARGLGLEPAAIGAIGDEMNDDALLDAAGHRYVVGGSYLAARRPDARAVATAAEGAVAEAIDRFLATLGIA